jgi:NADH-quinone oxidoreductase subunit N
MNVDQLLGIAPIITITGFVVLTMLSIAIRRNFVLTCLLAVCGIIIALLAICVADWKTPIQATSLIRVDVYARFYMALLLLAGLAVMGLSYDYFKVREGQYQELPLLLLTALLGGSVLVCSSHFASFLMGLEILSISLFTLIGYPPNQLRALEAAIKYLVLSGVSSAFLLMGMALIYAQCGELYFSAIGHYLANQPEINAVILGGALLIVSGLGFKLSLIPFHLWTPDVYEGAPAPITAFIATVSKGAVFVLLLRYLVSTGSYSYTPLLSVISVIAGISIITGNLLALLQNNVKRLLAYSSIAHMGYLQVILIAGAGMSSNLAIEAASFYLLGYFIATIGAFGVVSVLSTPQSEADDLAIFRGLFWRQPYLAAAFTLMLLSLAGIPLTVGFIGKFYLFVSAANSRLWALLFTVIIGSGIGIFYYLRIIVAMSLNLETAANDPGRSFKNRVSMVTLTVLTVLLVGLGIFPSFLINLIQTLSKIS